MIIIRLSLDYQTRQFEGFFIFLFNLNYTVILKLEKIEPASSSI